MVTQPSTNREPEEPIMQLAPHFSLDELVHTEVRYLVERNRIMAEGRMSQLRELAALLEQVRATLGGRAMSIHSGYRCPELNQLIGGSSTSQHLKGEAADFHVVGLPLGMAFDQIRNSALKWGQLILEGHNGITPTWIHVSLPAPWREEKDCQQVMIFDGRTYTRL